LRYRLFELHNALKGGCEGGSDNPMDRASLKKLILPKIYMKVTARYETLGFFGVN
jgi:hypothetical protein